MDADRSKFEINWVRACGFRIDTFNAICIAWAHSHAPGHTETRIEPVRTHVSIFNFICERNRVKQIECTVFSAIVTHQLSDGPATYHWTHHLNALRARTR